ncbi:MAG: hypothetical protein ACJAS1_003268 [Oleiphilaceae bacterium]|jgi:hypothetical protein
MNKTLRKIHTDKIDYYRPLLVEEYCQTLHYMSSNQKAQMLVSHARKEGLCDWKFMSGKILEEMTAERGVSKWMVQAILELLIKKNWQPDGDRLWALFMKTWLHECGPFSDVGEVLDSLPAHMNKLKALEWAIFFHEKLQASKRTQLICRVEDKAGNKVIHDTISSKLALEALNKRIPDINRENLEEKGYQLKHHYIFIEDIDLHQDIPEYQRALVRKKLTKATKQ